MSKCMIVVRVVQKMPSSTALHHVLIVEHNYEMTLNRQSIVIASISMATEADVINPLPPPSSSILPTSQSCDLHRNRPRRHVTAAWHETRHCTSARRPGVWINCQTLLMSRLNITPARKTCRLLKCSRKARPLASIKELIWSRLRFQGSQKKKRRNEKLETKSSFTDQKKGSSGFLGAKQILETCTWIITLWRSQIPPTRILK